MFIVLYAVIDRGTFDEAVRIARYIKQSRFLDSTAMLLVGTKKDLVHLRQVEKSEGKRISDRINCAFYEISISDNFTDTCSMFKNALRDYFGASSPSPEGSSTNLAVPKEKEKEKRSKSKMNKVLRTSFRRKNTVPVHSWWTGRLSCWDVGNGW